MTLAVLDTAHRILGHVLSRTATSVMGQVTGETVIIAAAPVGHRITIMVPTGAMGFALRRRTPVKGRQPGPAIESEYHLHLDGADEGLVLAFLDGELRRRVMEAAPDLVQISASSVHVQKVFSDEHELTLGIQLAREVALRLRALVAPVTRAPTAPGRPSASFTVPAATPPDASLLATQAASGPGPGVAPAVAKTGLFDWLRLRRR